MEEFYLKSIRIYQNHEEKISNAAVLYKKLADFSLKIDKLAKAEEYYLEYLKVNQKLFGEENSEVVATSWSHLAFIYFKMERISKKLWNFN